MSTEQERKPQNKKKVAHQELKKIDGWQFIFVPKYGQIIGCKNDVSFASVLLDKEDQPQVFEKGPNKGKFNIILATRPVVEFFTREEYNDFVEASD